MKLCDIIIGAIIKRISPTDHYGVVVLAEGLIGAIGEEGLVTAMESAGVVGRYGRVARDPHGHLRLGEIEFGRMVMDHMAKLLEHLHSRSRSSTRTSATSCAAPIRSPSMRSTPATWATGR